MTIFKGSLWSIVLPPEWVGEHDEDCSTIYNPEGVGALQISAYSKNGKVTNEDLMELANGYIPPGAKLASIEVGQFSGYSVALGFEGEFWQYWFVSHKATALFVSYNCEEADRDREIAQIKRMVSSLAAT